MLLFDWLKMDAIDVDIFDAIMSHEVTLGYISKGVPTVRIQTFVRHQLSCGIPKDRVMHNMTRFYEMLLCD